MDSWISLRNVESNGELNRILYLLKSRGMKHSKQLREYRLTDHGIDLTDVYAGADGVLTGTARSIQEARERQEQLARQQTTERRRRELATRRIAFDRKMSEMRAAIEAEEAEIALLIEQDERREAEIDAERSRRTTERGS